MKKHLAYSGCIALILCIIGVLFLGMITDSQGFYEEQPYIPAEIPYIEVSLPEGEIPLVGAAVQEWMENMASGEQIYQKYISGGRAYAAMTPVLNYGIYHIPAGTAVEKQTFALSTRRDLSDAAVTQLDGGKRSIALEYLFVDTTYYYQLTAWLSDGQEVSATGHFKTQASPRIIEVDGVWNLRDIGGTKTTDGRRIRQGLLYRGTELDGAKYQRYKITPHGAQAMTDMLGIKMEFDLRTIDLPGSQNMLGSSVRHTQYGFLSYYESLTPPAEQSLRNMFADLAKEDNYPMYVHCTYGKDRTGTLCYMLDLLLGVDEDTAYKKWELSSLFDGKTDQGSMTTYISAIKKLEGETMRQKLENYLLSIGVLQEQLDAVREILLEDQ